MRKDEQTEAVKVELYNLTLMFVRAYQPRYYKQFKGQIEDLASDFYTQFLTEKSREKGKEQSLLDKYDSTITTLPYLVKVAVQRMLIDRSRADRIPIKSIDYYITEFGDFMTKTFGLSTEDEEISIDEFEFSQSMIDTLKSRYSNLTAQARRSIQLQYNEIRDIINPAFKRVFDTFIPPIKKQSISDLNLTLSDGMSVKCQQITPKTVCILIDNKVIDFNRVTGVCRDKSKEFVLSNESLELIKSYDTYKSGYSRTEFELKFS